MKHLLKNHFLAITELNNTFYIECFVYIVLELTSP